LEGKFLHSLSTLQVFLFFSIMGLPKAATNKINHGIETQKIHPYHFFDRGGFYSNFI